MASPPELSEDEVLSPGSFTKNFSWGESSGLERLHRYIRVGFNGIVADVNRDEFRRRVSVLGPVDHIPINFFLFNKVIQKKSFIIADELVFNAITNDYSENFAKLALVAFNMSMVGTWIGAKSVQRRPALWAHLYIVNRVANQWNWDTSKLSAKDIYDFMYSDLGVNWPGLNKLSTNLYYMYNRGSISALKNQHVERWWIDSLFLTMDRLLESYALENIDLTFDDYFYVLNRAHFFEVSGGNSLEKTLAARHLLDLYIACGGRQRFSESALLTLRAVRGLDSNWIRPNDHRPRGAIHPSNVRILKSIPAECAMFAHYAGFDVISPDELLNFDVENYVRKKTEEALRKMKEGIGGTSMSAEEIFKITRDK